MPSQQQSSGQDLKPQVFNFGPKPTASKQKKMTEGQSNRTVQSGGNVEIVKKQFLAGNKHSTGPGANAKKLDEDHENLKVKRVNHSLSVNIQRTRQQKGLTQADLGRLINEKPSIITEYENGKAVPNEQVIVRMEKTLGIHLRGAKAGEPMEAKKPKTKA